MVNRASATKAVCFSHHGNKPYNAEGLDSTWMQSQGLGLVTNVSEQKQFLGISNEEIAFSCGSRCYSSQCFTASWATICSIRILGNCSSLLIQVSLHFKSLDLVPTALTPFGPSAWFWQCAGNFHSVTNRWPLYGPENDDFINFKCKGLHRCGQIYQIVWSKSFEFLSIPS